MIENKVIDGAARSNYNGGFICAARVARMARKANMWICPHNTQTGAASVNIPYLATTPNVGPYISTSRAPLQKRILVHSNFEIKNGVIPVPPAPVWAWNSTGVLKKQPS
jgi:L-alanine-DL-glutamate epimerase-like enolase superfamily enzyme